MKRCAEFQQELAACASLSQAPDANLARHLRECAGCREAFAEYERVAAIQIQIAARLPAPALRSNLTNRFENPAARPFLWRPIALAGTALFAVVLLIVGFREKPSPIPIPPSAGEASAAQLGPTWQAFRRELRRDSDPAMDLMGRGMGPAVTHYRLKDAYLETN